jgi:phage terminase large subunit-like protein
MPARLARRVLSVDPAISTRKGTDQTGIVELGRDDAGQVFALGDMSGAHPWEAWGALVVERYRDAHCDCVIVERNRGGDAVAANLRVYAERHGMRVVSVPPEGRTYWDPAVLFVVEITARGSKSSRAEPVASLYERGRVSHVDGADLAALEEELTTWEPGPGAESPNRLDALVHGVWLLAGLAVEQKRDAGAGVLGAAAVAAAGQQRAALTVGRSALTGIGVGFGGRGRI